MSMFRTESVHGVDEVDATSYEGAAEWHVRRRAPLDRPDLTPVAVTVTKMNDVGGKEPEPRRFEVSWARTLSVGRAKEIWGADLCSPPSSMTKLARREGTSR